MLAILTERTRKLLILLSLLILAAIYYYGVQVPVSNRIYAAQEEQASVSTSIEIENIKAQKMSKMQSIIDSAGDNYTKAELPVYDNIENVMIQLDTILGSTTNYSLSFDQIITNENLIYRPIKMSFTGLNYSIAEEVLENLNNCQYRCMLDDISVASTSSSNPDITSGEVSVSLTITFIEKLS